MTGETKLSDFLGEMIHWDWLEFLQAEKKGEHTGNEGVVFGLVRACAKGKLSAIKTAIDRIDGKVATPIKEEFPMFFFLYPHAKSIDLPEGVKETDEIATQSDPLKEEPKKEDDDKSVVTLTLRETVEKMADSNIKVVPLVLDYRDKLETAFKTDKDISEFENPPLVKAIIAANLLDLARNGNLEAINEVFERLEGKLVEVIKYLGEDVYVTMFAEKAPYGAKKNKNGIYQVEVPQISNLWKEKLKPSS